MTASTLREAGIANPARLAQLIRRCISFFELDLTGLTVLTEAASGPYVVTPIIAALAGAERVIALTRSSPYATSEAVLVQTRALEQLCGCSGRVEIVLQRDSDLFAVADIVTNLGFVRPLDASLVAVLKPTAVVPLMCEAWEARPGDVDLEACRARGIPVIGTNEDFPGLDVFNYSGWLCQKLLFDAQIEIHKSVLVVVSGDKFGRVIYEHLVRSGANVRLMPTLHDRQPLAGADAIIVADYTRDDPVIGAGGDMGADEFGALAPATTVVQFAGRIDVEGLRTAGIAVFPGVALPAHRMALTLAALGPRPVVELHTAGLKVGELAARARRKEGGAGTAESNRFRELLQPLTPVQPHTSG